MYLPKIVISIMNLFSYVISPHTSGPPTCYILLRHSRHSGATRETSIFWVGQITFGTVGGQSHRGAWLAVAPHRFGGAGNLRKHVHVQSGRCLGLSLVETVWWRFNLLVEHAHTPSKANTGHELRSQSHTIPRGPDDTPQPL